MERLTLCRESQRYEKGENVNISTDELQASYDSLGGLRLACVIGSSLQEQGLPCGHCCLVHLLKGVPKVDFFNFCHCTGFPRLPHVPPLTTSVPEASL